MSASPPTYTITIDYTRAFEGPGWLLIRYFRREDPPLSPDETRIQDAIQRAYVHGYILRDRYDNPMKRHTRLTFRRRANTRHDYRPEDIHADDDTPAD
jgi:hypothetical protein